MKTLSIVLLGLMAVSGFAQSGAEVYKNADNVALNGYDVVSYHSQHQAVRGNNQHSLSYQDGTYYFASAENMQAFTDKPEAYLPKYGGYCAFAMAMKDALVPSDPMTFKIHNGDLYLFFNDFYEGQPFNTIVPWNQDERAMSAKAEANWRRK